MDPAQRHALILRAWEAVNAERDLRGVLDAVTRILKPVVHFDSLTIVSFDTPEHRLIAYNLSGLSALEGETMEELMRRAGWNPPPVPFERPLLPYPKVDWKVTSPAPATCGNLLEKEGWYAHEFKLVAGGVRAYTACHLIVRGECIGVAVYCRLEPVAFPYEELSVLADVSKAMAIAAANAVANEEIVRLRDQLEAENIALRTQLGQAPWYEDIVGGSAPLRRVLEGIEQVATTDSTVLVLGETGTGKELVARALHRRSPRARGKLVKVNCAAIPPTLLASELFGHERGAFTGAVERRQGRFEQANGGTLFLDEIGELPMETQVMLLRVLQEREFERLGGSQTVRVDVRVITATNRDLAEEVRAGRFRSDLYYRLNVFPIRLPPLRERPEDISQLVAHFAAKHGVRFSRTITRIDRRAMSALENYSWPGNVRELENVVERAVILSRNGTLRLDRDALPGGTAEENIDAALRDQERQAIETALRATGGRVAGEKGAAKRLGLPASTLEFRIKRLGIDRFQYRKADLKEHAQNSPARGRL
jgi:formate hydrogenlyase transcriptional activator